MNNPHAGKLAMVAMFALGACSESSHEATPDDNETVLKTQAKKARIVLVHGAFADATGWQKVIPLLERRGYAVTAVQDPLTSLADDIATTKRVLDAESLKGPVIAVGHSFGGAAITGAAAGNPEVKALVYVNAFGPDEGEILGQLVGRFGPGELMAALIRDTAGFLYIERSKFKDVFCADVTVTEARVMAAVQKPVQELVFGQSLAQAAWKTIPSFYLLGRQDRTIAPELQRFMATRMGAEITEIDSSHLPFVSHPEKVVSLIERAARITLTSP